jgi:hypothetical protein
MVKNIFSFVIFWLSLLCALAVACESNMEEVKSPDKLNSEQNGKGEGMRVLWTVSAYKIFSGAKWGENEARALLFKPLDINSSSITFNFQTCQGIYFTSEIVDTDKYFSERHQIKPQMLDISEETIRVFKTDCQLPGFSEYIQLTDGSLIVWIEGVFFFFEPNIKK